MGRPIHRVQPLVSGHEQGIAEIDVDAIARVPDTLEPCAMMAIV
jgi:hypothetical protein